MTENKRFTIKPQDDLFGVVDNYSTDKVCVVNGIRTEIEAKWLCKDMNALNDENEQLKEENQILKYMIERNNNYITDLMSFIKSKGYVLKDFLKYVGQFRIVEVNKEDWND